MDYFRLSAGQDTIERLSALGLAHLGDGVYELMVRSWLCLHGKATNAGLHKAAVKYVAAPAQAKLVHAILPMLTEEAEAGSRPGRASPTPAVPQGGPGGGYYPTPPSGRFRGCGGALAAKRPHKEIGRASCRERV